MKRLILMGGFMAVMALCLPTTADYVKTTVVTGKYSLKTGGKVQPVTYDTQAAAMAEQDAMSKRCLCRVDVLQPNIQATSVVVKTSSSSAASSMAAATIVPIKPVKVTASTETGTNVAPLAVDGIAGTRWESKWQTDPSWLMLDFGSSRQFSRVEVDWEDSNAEDYALRGSTDGASWGVLSVVTGGSFGARTDTLQVSGTYRYLRLDMTKRAAANQWGYSVYELRVFGYGAPVTMVNATFRTDRPKAWTDGTLLLPADVYGYELRTGGSKTVVQSSADTVIATVSVPINTPTTVAAVSTSGVYSDFVPVQ